MRLVAYLRLSSGTQIDGYGLDVQRIDCRRWARINGHKIVAEHHDVVTGKTDALDRPGLSETLQLLRKPPLGTGTRPADGLIVGKIDRLARALTVQEATLAMVWKLEAQVFAADMGEIVADDPDDPMRTAMRQMAGVFAELERRTIAKRMRDGMKAKRATGRHATGVYPYGYHGVGRGRDRDAGPLTSEQQAVARILELRADAASYREIAAALDAEGLAPRKAARWSAMAVRNVYLRESEKAAR